MPASGKSTIGVILAKILGYDFIDTDLLIQKREGSRLHEIIFARGIDTFLEVEASVCRDLQVSRTVIATGGSVVSEPEAMDHLRSFATVIYLQVELDTLKERLNDIVERGVVLKVGQTIDDLYRERKVLYERYADITISEEGLSLEKTVERIIGACRDRVD